MQALKGLNRRCVTELHCCPGSRMDKRSPGGRLENGVNSGSQGSALLGTAGVASAGSGKSPRTGSNRGSAQNECQRGVVDHVTDWYIPAVTQPLADRFPLREQMGYSYSDRGAEAQHRAFGSGNHCGQASQYDEKTAYTRRRMSSADSILAYEGSCALGRV